MYQPQSYLQTVCAICALCSVLLSTSAWANKNPFKSGQVCKADQVCKVLKSKGATIGMWEVEKGGPYIVVWNSDTFLISRDNGLTWRMIIDIGLYDVALSSQGDVYTLNNTSYEDSAPTPLTIRRADGTIEHKTLPQPGPYPPLLKRIHIADQIVVVWGSTDLFVSYDRGQTWKSYTTQPGVYSESNIYSEPSDYYDESDSDRSSLGVDKKGTIHFIQLSEYSCHAEQESGFYMRIPQRGKMQHSPWYSTYQVGPLHIGVGGWLYYVHNFYGEISPKLFKMRGNRKSTTIQIPLKKIQNPLGFSGSTVSAMASNHTSTFALYEGQLLQLKGNAVNPLAKAPDLRTFIVSDDSIVLGVVDETDAVVTFDISNPAKATWNELLPSCYEP